jgi:hypothetical protein
MIAPRLPPDPFRGELAEGIQSRMASHAARVADDTVADDAAEAFLSELDEALWVLERVQRAEETAFEHAARKADHIEDFRRLLYRLHLVLSEWEGHAA